MLGECGLEYYSYRSQQDGSERKSTCNAPSRLQGIMSKLHASVRKDQGNPNISTFTLAEHPFLPWVSLKCYHPLQGSTSSFLLDLKYSHPPRHDRYSMKWYRVWGRVKEELSDKGGKKSFDFYFINNSLNFMLQFLKRPAALPMFPPNFSLSLFHISL